jgi:hypothetical protein
MMMMSFEIEELADLPLDRQREPALGEFGHDRVACRTPGPDGVRHDYRESANASVSGRGSCGTAPEPPYHDRDSNLEIDMSADGSVRQTLSFKKANQAVIYQKLDALLAEWRDWLAELEEIPYPPVNPHNPVPFQSLFRDSQENLKRHRILQEKTIVFLDNNIDGHGFICSRDGSKIDRQDLWLKDRARHRVDDLDELRACLAYANVPDGYWKATAKDALGKIKNMAPEAAVDFLAKVLQGP